jgi:hypothetical protein
MTATPSSARLASVDALTNGLVDYAGLFPPAGLEMEAALRHYASCLTDPQRAMLGRFVVPAARLEELEGVALATVSRVGPGTPWRISALVGPDAPADAARIADFNRRQGPGRGTGWAIVDTIEAPASTSADLARILASRPDDVTLYVELPTATDPSPMIADLALVGARAKVRTGGLTAESIPSSAALVRFFRACARAAVPFKATAGLHHPIRAAYPLTYEPGAATAVMHGFVNLFVAATFVRIGVPASDAVAMLDETSPSAFAFDADGVTWRTRRATTPAIRAARANYATSFGSCSFREPADELRGLGW